MTGPDRRDIRVDVTVTSDTRQGDKAADTLADVGTSADKAGKSLKGMSVDARTLNAEIDKVTHRLGELDAQLVSIDDKDARREHRQLSSRLRFLQGVAKRAIPSPTDDDNIHDLKSILGSIPSVGRGALIGSAVGLGALMAPAIGAIVSGAVVGAAGAGGVVGGIIAASSDPRVRSAWDRFMESLSPQDFGAEAFVGPTIEAIQELRSALEEAGIGELMAKAATFVEPLSEGIGDFARNIVPGLTEAFDNADPVMDEFGKGLGDMGKAIGDMVRDMSESEGAASGMRYTFMLLNGAIHVIGDTMAGLGTAFERTRKFGADFTGVMEDVFGVEYGGLGGGMFARLNNDLERIGGNVPVMHSMANAVHVMGDEVKYGADAVQVLSAAWHDLLDVQLRADQAAMSLEENIDRLSESVEKNGHSLDVHTEKGRANRQIFLDMIEDAKRARDDMRLDPNFAAAANTTYNEQIAKIREIGEAAGFTKEQLDKLVGPYEITIIRKTKFITVGNPNASSNSSWGGGFQEFEGRASGGPVMAGVPYRINERGSEVVTFPAGGRVHPANLTPMGGGGAGVRPLVIRGSGLGAALLEALREEVAREGGELAVLNLKAPS